MAIRALSTAATGMISQQNRIDVIANNLANVNTTGFKRVRANFEDLLYQQIRENGFRATEDTTYPTDISLGLGTKLVATDRIFTQGPLDDTGKDTDMAIEGEGFFRIRLPDGTIAYTRDGSFHRDAQGQIVNNAGFILDPQITVPQEVVSIFVTTTGLVQGFDPANSAAAVDIGQITLSRFQNPAGLTAIGSNLFKETGASGNPIEGNPGDQSLGFIRHHFIEGSAVEAVRELVDMIQAQRAFEINAQTIQTADQMLQTVNNLRR